MDAGHYKHAITVSSQGYFCSSPIRLDSYNRCQFGCHYCFSRNRAKANSKVGLRTASVNALRARFKRISDGRIFSALDEFLLKRVPIQFGGMQDPFSPFERQFSATLDLLRILVENDYPTLLSTKSDLLVEPEYLDLLRQGNFYVRLSASSVNSSTKSHLEPGTPSHEAMLGVCDSLSRSKVPVSIRVQPVIPGFESEALKLTDMFARAGAKHFSYEYLKMPTEGLDGYARRLKRALGFDVWEYMRAKGVYRLGRDYLLRPEEKVVFLREARERCRLLGVGFGAGDTEFIHFSDGAGCCNGSEAFLRSAHQFKANFVGLLKPSISSRNVRFSDIDSTWSPSFNVHPYLTTNSRGRFVGEGVSSWKGLVRHRWFKGTGPYWPGFFWGVKETGESDSDDLPIYRAPKEL